MMLHIAAFCPPQSGHINPMLALARAVQGKGHRVTYFGFPDAERRVRRAGLGYHSIAAADWPLGRTDAVIAELGGMTGITALRYTLKQGVEQARLFLRDAPAALREERVDGVMSDQTCIGVESVAEHLGLPFVSVADILMMNVEGDVPPPVSPWRYSKRLLPRLRNRAAYRLAAFTTRHLYGAVNARRREWGLKPIRNPREQKHFSQLAQVGQMPAEMDFPRKHLPPVYHYCGAWTDSEERAPVPFPWERLDGRPQIYCSLGTVQNRLQWMFRAIARECEGLDAQLVISLGGGGSPEEYQGLPGDPIVVGFAPQLALLKTAALCICHGGLNTTLEAVQSDVPVVAIPITNDQGGVATRIEYCGIGEMILPDQLKKPGTLRSAVGRVMKEPSYKSNVFRIHEAVRAAGGAERAAEIVIRAVSTGRPVYADATRQVADGPERGAVLTGRVAGAS
jgi:MGT family glycosyltransferase